MKTNHKSGLPVLNRWKFQGWIIFGTARSRAELQTFGVNRPNIGARSCPALRKIVIHATCESHGAWGFGGDLDQCRVYESA
jgi:hypothetical protein